MDQTVIQRTVENLKRNGMDAVVVPTCDMVRKQVQTYLSEGDTAAFGGSVSLEESGILSLLRSLSAEGKLSLLDRGKEGLSAEDIARIMRDAFSADVYFTSSNAITAEGRLYNVDGNGNRTAAMIFGPKTVIVVAGINKIVENDERAIARVREIAAPKNGVRLGLDTPCAKVGHCVDCMHDQRMCASYVFLGKQRTPGRIKVVLVEETLGY